MAIASAEITATPPPDPVAGYDAAIARRNLLWIRWQDAGAILEWAPSSAAIRAYNEAQHDYEWATHDLVKARVMLGRPS